jgi:predicted ATPase
MNTFLMGQPFAQKKTGGAITLNKDGRNIAEYLLSIRDADLNAYTGILESLQTVLPYAKDLQPQVTRELEKAVYLQLTEQDFKLPGWMLSTGTLKILALLAVFRHPNPSPLIVIEEIENGLDPRTINLIVNEIRSFVKSKSSQVIITTHSPYLLDLLHLSHVVFVERKNERVVFKRPYDDEELRKWSKDYTPGELYEKDLLQQYLSK